MKNRYKVQRGLQMTSIVFLFPWTLLGFVLSSPFYLPIAIQMAPKWHAIGYFVWGTSNYGCFSPCITFPLAIGALKLGFPLLHMRN